MTEPVISVEGLSKLYRLGQTGTGSLLQDLSRAYDRLRGRADDDAKLVEPGGLEKANASGSVWALRDVSLEARRGEVLGVIGRNGAGKTTLLKVLSRVTAPTSGRIRMRGRMASLLEVGTGFHPDLSGRDNIFLNGAILGMTRAETLAKFDEIVEFAGVGRYIDTPVKRYSSGMYVRLAFAVAAHLEPEILVVDEVLAVGDVEFQRKCLGRMGEVSRNDGRTILFVSHNMEAVRSLCHRAVLLEGGQLTYDGPVNTCIDRYLAGGFSRQLERVWEGAECPSNERVRVTAMRVVPEPGRTAITPRTALRVEIEYDILAESMVTNFSLHFSVLASVTAFVALSVLPAPRLTRGHYTGTCYVPADLLNATLYTLTLYVVRDTSVPELVLENVLTFEVFEERDPTNWHGVIPGMVRPKLAFPVA